MFSFVTIYGTENLMWATKIAERYVGKEKADEYGRRNSSEGTALV